MTTLNLYQDGSRGNSIVSCFTRVGSLLSSLPMISQDKVLAGIGFGLRHSDEEFVTGALEIGKNEFVTVHSLVSMVTGGRAFRFEVASLMFVSDSI